jgi:hydroxymethylpyrimidine pyrophosphatase-like HAD family hydrolase
VTSPRFGLLLDVDGPVASPVSRTVPPGIIRHLVQLAAAGWPVIFNTGRSDDFIRKQVMKPMIAAGLSADTTVHAICEKGAVWFSFTGAGPGEPQVDSALALPQTYADAIRELVAAKYGDHMFYDETKRAMVSVEQHVDVVNADYQEFDTDALALMRKFDLGVCRLDHHAPDSDDSIDYRIDPTIISTDIEALGVGKDLGARRALSLLADAGTEVPHIWRTVGDSRTDYAMADELHALGYDVAHVDVRPADGVPDKPYPVLTAGERIHEDAGGAYFERWAAMAAGEASDDDAVS